MVVQAWVEQGLFGALADGTARPLQDLPGDPRALAITASILGHLGLLTRLHGPNGELWALSTSGRALLPALGPGSTPPADLVALPRVLAEGGPVPGPDGVRRPHKGGSQPATPDATRRFLDWLYRRSQTACEDIARVVLARWGERRGRVLDLGGGHGRYGKTLAELGFDVAVFDQPLVCDLGRERYGDALTWLAGDFQDPGFGPEVAGGDYELVLMSNIVHSLSPAEVQGLLRRLRPVVRPGGALLIKDMFLDNTAVGPESAVMFGLVMLMYNEGGRSYGIDQMRDWLGQAGYPSVEHTELLDQGYACLIAR